LFLPLHSTKEPFHTRFRPPPVSSADTQQPSQKPYLREFTLSTTFPRFFFADLFAFSTGSILSDPKLAMVSARPLAQLRHYSHRLNPNDSSRLKGYAMTGYLCAAFALPFVPPYLASKRTKQDGTWLTR